MLRHGCSAMVYQPHLVRVSGYLYQRCVGLRRPSRSPVNATLSRVASCSHMGACPQIILIGCQDARETRTTMLRVLTKNQLDPYHDIWFAPSRRIISWALYYHISIICAFEVRPLFACVEVDFSMLCGDTESHGACCAGLNCLTMQEQPKPTK